MMRKTIDKLLEGLLISIMTVMLLSVIWQVISRYLLGIPSTFTDEIASFSLIWLGLFGSAYATGQELHLAIDLVPKKVIQRAPSFFNTVIPFAITVFGLLVLVVGGSRLCYLTFSLQQKSSALEIPLGYVYLVLPISGFLIVYYCLDSYFMKRKIDKN